MEINFTAKLSLSDHLPDARFLFVWSLSSHSRIFHSYGDVTIAGEGLQILIYARHSCPLSSEGSLTYHTYCDTGLPFIMGIYEDPCHSHLLPSVWEWSCHYLFVRLRSVATGDRTPNSRMRGERSTSTPPRRSRCYVRTADDVRPANSRKCENIIITHHR